MVDTPPNYEEIKTRLQTDGKFRAQLIENPQKFKEDQQLSAEYVEKLLAKYGEKSRNESDLIQQGKQLIILAWVYFLIVTVHWVLSNFSPEILRSIKLPLWSDLHVVIRWIIGIYWAIAGPFAILNTRKIFVGQEKTSKTTRTTFWTIIVVLVIIPGAITYRILPTENQIVVTQIILVVIFTALPASLFPLFIASKGKALWGEFVNNLIFLDPVGYQNRSRIYYKKFESLYGRLDSGESVSQIFAGQAGFPVYLNTLIIGVGWLLFFITVDIQANASSHSISGVVSPFTFGFLGAYLFSLGMLFRRYIQADLKTTAYTHSNYRILWTWVLAFILSSLPLGIFQLDTQYQNQVISLVAFTAGIFPEIAFQLIGQVLKSILGIAIPSFRQEHPLNEISGITVWVEARLLEENIENIQNLVTIDIPDLMLRTNIHPSRIVDWIDQGILLLHLQSRKSGIIFNRNEKTDFENKIRERGIVTATDLEYSWEDFKNNMHERIDKHFLSSAKNQAIAETMVVSFSDDPNMYHIKAWREVYEKHKCELDKSADKLLNTLKLDGRLPELIDVGNDQTVLETQ